MKTDIELEEGEEEIVMSESADVYGMDDGVGSDVADTVNEEIQEEEDDGDFIGEAVAEE